jgi:hypothetical protein
MAQGVTISRSDTSRNILKNCVLSIIIRGLFVKNQDRDNNISQFEVLMLIFYCGPFSAVGLVVSGSFNSTLLIRYLVYIPVRITGNKCAP